MSIFNPDKVLKPRGGARWDSRGPSLALLVYPLHLTVGLGKVSRGEADCGSDERTECPLEPRRKVWRKPCRRKTCCNSASAVSLAAGNLGMGTKCIILENIPTTVSNMVLPSEWGSPAMKSKVMSDQGRWGTSRGGWRWPAGQWVTYSWNKWGRWPHTPPPPSPWQATRTAVWFDDEHGTRDSLPERRMARARVRLMAQLWS